MGKYSSIDKHCVNFKQVNLETFLIKYGEHTEYKREIVIFYSRYFVASDKSIKFAVTMFSSDHCNKIISDHTESAPAVFTDAV